MIFFFLHLLIQFLECLCEILLLYLEIKHCLFYLYIMCFSSYFVIIYIYIYIFIFAHFGLN